MKITYLVSMGGETDHHPGDPNEVSDEEALRLIDSGFATADEDEVKKLRKRVKTAQTKAEKKQREVEKLMHEDELKTERNTLMSRVHEITKTLGDGGTFYPLEAAEEVIDLDEEKTPAEGEGEE